MKNKLLVVIWLILLSPYAYTDEKSAPPEQDTEDSPWLITPLLSSDPKISTAAGLMGAYVHKYDEESPPSMFGVAGAYSTTDSWYAGLFGMAFFGQDKHRLTTAIVTGEVRNDYEDFIGSGLDVQTTDDVTMFGLRYRYRFYGRWFLGPQFVATNYAISGDNLLSGQVLEHIGLTGFESNGVGLYTQYDSRDNQYSPTIGRVFEAHNIAYRESLGGDVSFDTLTADYQHFTPHGKGNVIAVHARGRWTDDAPVSGYSSVDMRGYTRGQYLAPHMTMVEGDYRYSMNEKWGYEKLGLAAFAGVAYLYGYDSEEEEEELYPAGGAGVFYRLNNEGMVVRFDAAMGKEGNYGFYLQFGHGFEK